jgi:hypothetical protein
MRKIVAICLIGVLVISGLGVNALPKDNNTISTMTQNTTISVSDPVIVEADEYLRIEMDQATSYLHEDGRPSLPVFSTTYTMPLGSSIIDLKVTYDVDQTVVSRKIAPSSAPVPLTNDLPIDIQAATSVFDIATYESASLYPAEPYEVRKGAGMVHGEHVMFVTIDCFTQYSPSTDTLFIPGDISIEMVYEQPTIPLFAMDEYDMLIITTDEFADLMQPLVAHKITMGINTVVDTVENIYAAYNGRDDAEDIKLRIKDAIEDWGIDYVLLAGGRDGQTTKWLVPSRTTHNDDGWEGGYESDLYFSDVYKIVENETVFEDWDSDGDGVFAEFGVRGDKMDYYPDVTVGRLPFRSSKEIAPVIQKIIDYETTADDSWFKKGIVISGDTFPPSRGGDPGWWEGELETGLTVGRLESIGYTVNKLWLSIPGAWEGPQDVIDAISEGAGFVHFAGHSNPASWGNHPPDDEEHIFVDGIRIWDMKKFTNTGKYPVVVLGGCHSAQFNVTMSNLISGILEYGIGGYFFKDPFRFYYYEWVPNDMSSKFVLVPNGGAVACMGNSGLGYGYVNEGWDSGLGGWIEPRFFDAFVNQSIDIVGKAHDKAIIDYINIIGSVNTDQIDRKTIEEWVLLGDPSTKMGGY